MHGPGLTLAELRRAGLIASVNNTGGWGTALSINAQEFVPSARNDGGWGTSADSARNDGGWGSEGGDGGDSPYSGHGSPFYTSPHYAPTDPSTTGHCGDISASVDSSDCWCAVCGGSPPSVDGAGCACEGSATFEAGSGGTQQDASTNGGSAASEGLSPVTAPERELEAFVKLWRAACLSRKMSMSSTSDRWPVRDRLTSDFVHLMCNELGWFFTAGQLEKRMTEADSYKLWRAAGLSESRAQAWCRRLGEELATKDSVLDHWELAG